MFNDKILTGLMNWYLISGLDETTGEEAINRFNILDNEEIRIQDAECQPQVFKKELQPKYINDNNNEIRKTFIEPGVEAATDLALSAQTVEQLITQLQQFDGCALKRTATNLVFIDGNIAAPLLFIGEAPGAEEDKSGQPFVGPSGKLLDAILESVGLDRTKVLISNTVFWRPPGNRTPTLLETAVCLPFIQRLIELVCPKIIVTLGGPAAKSLLNQPDGVSRIRGQWFDYKTPNLKQKIPTLVMFHPAYLLRSPYQKRLAWHDIRAIARRLKQITN